MKISKIHQPIVIPVRSTNTRAAPYTLSLLIKRANYLAAQEKSTNNSVSTTSYD